MPASTADLQDLRVLAIIEHATLAARSVGRWDAFHAIYDLLAAEIPTEAYNAIAWALATDRWADYCQAYRVLGSGRGDEYAHWCFDIMRELGTWVTWDLGEGLKYGLSQFERWTPPKHPEQIKAEKIGSCGRPGHGRETVRMDPRGPDYALDPATMIEICDVCFCDWCDAVDERAEANDQWVGALVG